jgi:hypothetical protein
MKTRTLLTHLSLPEGCSHRRWWRIRSALCKPTSGRFFVIWTVWTGHLILRRGSVRVLLQTPSPTCSRHNTPPTSSLRALKRKLAARGKRVLRLPSIVGWFFRLPSPACVVGTVAPGGCPLVLVAAQVPPSAKHGDATSVILGTPPLEMGEQMRRLLSRSPGAACQSCHAMTNGQIHPFDESGVQPSREAESLQRELKSGLCPQAHDVRDPNQFAPPIAFFHLAVD